jgi:hypothetical protein
VAEIEVSDVQNFAPSRGNRDDLRQKPLARKIALRTAFVSRFILIRESRRSRAHRLIEVMDWDYSSTAEDLYDMFRAAFVKNGDKLEAVDRDLRRALSHAYCSIEHFIGHYVNRSTTNFIDALEDYKKSNKLLLGEEVNKEIKSVGWRLP